MRLQCRGGSPSERFHRHGRTYQPNSDLDQARAQPQPSPGGGGLPVTWTGGSPGSYVVISGGSASGGATGAYTCIAPQSALTFTVPSYVLLGLPAGTGSTTVTNSTNLSIFAATGLDFGGAVGTVAFSVNSNYN